MRQRDRVEDRATGTEQEEGGSTLGIVLRAIAEAPLRAKVGLLLNTILITAALAFAAWEWVFSAARPEPFRLAGLALGLAGVYVLAVAMVLHKVSQLQALDCSRGVRMQIALGMRSEVLDRVFQALPSLGVVASILLAAGIALYIPLVGSGSFSWIVVGLFAWYLALGVRTVSRSTRFLYRHAREQAAAAEKARSEATEARLAALQAQMNPHFLFNTLNTVASLIRTDSRTAESTVENLAEVLRRTLDRSRRTLGTLGEEVDYLESYLGVEKERWGDRLHVQWEIAPETLELELPPMTLQPLVENALKHGIGTRLEGGVLTIASARDNGRLSLSVADDGVGFPVRVEEMTGLGNLRKRLTTLYGEACDLRVERLPRGSRVVVEIPVDEEASRGVAEPD
jgi:signal transduction histidine kinase